MIEDRFYDEIPPTRDDELWFALMEQIDAEYEAEHWDEINA